MLVVLDCDAMLGASQRNNYTVFVTGLSLSFFVASFSGETLRGDAAADIANKTVSSYRILLYRPPKFEVVFVAKISPDLSTTVVFSTFMPSNSIKLFVFLKF